MLIICKNLVLNYLDFFGGNISEAGKSQVGFTVTLRTEGAKD